MAIKKKRLRTRAKSEYGITHSCDLCEKGDATAMALVEGERLALCNGCKKFGRVISSLDLAEHKTPDGTVDAEPSEELVENYGKLIRNRRMQMNLSIEQLAQKLRQPKSYLQKIEQQALSPSLDVAKKLQTALGVKLFEKPED